MLRWARPAGLLARRWARGLALQKFPVPAMGDSITEGTLLELSKQAGEYVAQEEILATVETDKVTVDVRSPAAGTIKAWFAEAGQNIIVGDDLIEIDVGVGDASAAATAPTPAVPVEASAPAPVVSPPTPADGRVHPSGNPSLIRFRSAGPQPSPAPSSVALETSSVPSKARAPYPAKPEAKGPVLDATAVSYTHLTLPTKSIV